MTQADRDRLVTLKKAKKKLVATRARLRFTGTSRLTRTPSRLGQKGTFLPCLDSPSLRLDLGVETEYCLLKLISFEEGFNSS